MERQKRLTESIWRNERGSTAIFTVFLLGIVFVASIFLFYFFSVYVEKRQSQNIADGVALAAVDVLRTEFKKDMQDSVSENVALLRQRVQELYDAQPDPPEPDEDEEGESPPPPPKKTREEILRELISGQELADKLVSGRFRLADDWLLVVKETYFASQYTADRNGDRLYDAYVQNAGLIEAAVRGVVDRNGGEREGTVISFPIDGKPLLYAEAVNKVVFESVVAVDEELAARSAGSIGSSHFAIDVSRKPVRKIML